MALLKNISLCKTWLFVGRALEIYKTSQMAIPKTFYLQFGGSQFASNVYGWEFKSPFLLGTDYSVGPWSPLDKKLGLFFKKKFKRLPYKNNLSFSECVVYLALQLK